MKRFIHLNGELCLFGITFVNILFSTAVLSQMNTEKSLLRVLFIVPVILSILLNSKHTIIPQSFLVLLFASTFCFFFSFPSESHLNLVTFFVTAICVNQVGFKNSVRVMFYATLLGLVVVIIGSKIGVFPEQIGSIRTYIIGNFVRRSIGFGNPNYFGLVMYQIAIFLMFSKIKKKFLFSMIIVALIPFISGSRTPLYSYLFFGFTLLLLKNSKSRFFKKSFVVFALSVIFIVGIGLPIFSTYLVTNFPKLDEFLSYRLTLMSLARNSDASLLRIIFGGGIPQTNSSYYSITISFGLIFIVILFVILICRAIELFESGNIVVLSFVLSYMAYGVSEAVLLSPAIGLSTLFWWIIFFSPPKISPKNKMQTMKRTNQATHFC